MISIPDNEIRFIFSRSSGKGGQNVNKVETRVQLVWNPEKTRVFWGEEKARLVAGLLSRLTGSGDLILTAGSERTQKANVAIARHKLASLIEKALKKPNIRLKTRPTYGSRLKRLDGKRKISLKKKNRKILEF